MYKNQIISYKTPYRTSSSLYITAYVISQVVRAILVLSLTTAIGSFSQCFNSFPKPFDKNTLLSPKNGKYSVKAEMVHDLITQFQQMPWIMMTRDRTVKYQILQMLMKHSATPAVGSVVKHHTELCQCLKIPLPIPHLPAHPKRN